MNKNFRSIWNDSTKTWMAVPETVSTKGKSKSTLLQSVAVAAISIAALNATSSYAQSGFVLCSTGGLHSYLNSPNTSIQQGGSACSNSTSYYLGSGTNVQFNGITSGISGNSQTVGLKAPTSVTLTAPLVSINGATTLNGYSISNLAAGSLPTDAVNVSQLQSLSTSTSTSLGSAISSISSLSTGLSTTNSAVASLSTSTSTGISSLSTGLSSTNSSVTSLSTSA
ncbi:ESPR domain-containing protein, partial [Variovorax atrisoli]|uniref:ESPR domain-containing protein n=1 Tax=Variovorax atrisoli TaxID=3394203 RepID=UPI001ABFFACE